MEHSDLVALTAYMAEVGYTATEVATAVAKPWMHEAILADMREVEYYERTDTPKPVPTFAQVEGNKSLLGEMMRESDADLAWRAFARRDQLT